MAFHPAPSSHSGTRPLPAPRIPPRLRILCAWRLPRPVRGVGVYPDRVGAFSSHDLCPLNFKLLALSVVEGSTVDRSSLSPFLNSHRITSFAHPHRLTPIESHLCKKQGGGGPPYPNRGRLVSCRCATRRNPRNTIPFMRLLHNSRTSRGGGLGQKKKEGTMNRAPTRRSCPLSGSSTHPESTRELCIRKVRATAR